MKFEGTRDYVATEDLKIAVNAAITLERPLLVKGEPGTGKTELARQVASALDLPIIPKTKLLAALQPQTAGVPMATAVA